MSSDEFDSDVESEDDEEDADEEEAQLAPTPSVPTIVPHVAIGAAHISRKGDELAARFAAYDGAALRKSQADAETERKRREVRAAAQPLCNSHSFAPVLTTS